MKKYIEVKENPKKITHLKIELYYSLGGYNNWFRTQEPRGYYLAVEPIERMVQDEGYTLERYAAFSGIKQTIKQVTRKSKKAEAEAEKLAADAMDNLIDYACKEHGLEIAEVETIPA